MKVFYVLATLLMVCMCTPPPFQSSDFYSQQITPNSQTTIDSINTLNSRIRSSLKLLVNKSFFKYFKLNLYKECPFWNSNHFCINENCAVDVLDWSKVNETMKPSKLGSILGNKTVCETLNYCKIDDDKDDECVWVSLVQNPERFTGYGGEQSSQIWSAIYNENCFPFENCSESNFFYKLISGLHASIATHLSNEYLDFVTGEFKPNLKIFMERVGNFNERILNVYFNYAILAQSITKLNTEYNVNSLISNATHFGELNESIETNYLINDISSNLPAEIINTSSIFQDKVLKNEFRSKFRNVSQIMDCVGCDRCRMWGKIQILGYGTALKILFEDFNEIEFSNFEIIALYNTFDRLSKSVESINDFINMHGAGDFSEDITLQLSSNENENLLLDSTKLSRKPQVIPLLSNTQSQHLTLNEKKQASEPQSKQQQRKGLLKPKKKRDKSKKLTLSEEFKEAYDDVYEGLTFVLKSYYLFPRILFNILILKLNLYWNRFIGREEFYDYKANYDKLFELVDL